MLLSTPPDLGKKENIPDIPSNRKKLSPKEFDHWHRHDPDRSNKNKYYLDECGKRVLKGFKHSHIRIKEFIN
ncbi:MAG: hypothetical protein KBA66_07995 [Leptospiraceae bacterium]|nr:hypothetical protein [Leptospiraceae bacterium]